MNESSSSPGVPRFGREFFGAKDSFTRIGDGALGGKATGLLRVREGILSKLDVDEFPYIEVAVPTATVLTTDVFDSFIERNHLEEIANSSLSDDRIAHAFQQAELPAEHVGDLRGLVSSVHTPLARCPSSFRRSSASEPATAFTHACPESPDPTTTTPPGTPRPRTAS
jgi:hypothetical protein